MKTALQWFKTFPEPYRTQAIEIVRKRGGFTRTKWPDAATALEMSFYWSGTPQRHAYWSQVHGCLRNNQPFPEFNPLDLEEA